MSQTLKFAIARQQIKSLTRRRRNAISIKAQRETPRKPGAHRAQERNDRATSPRMGATDASSSSPLHVVDIHAKIKCRLANGGAA